MPKYCKKCGRTIADENGYFCPNCGTKLTKSKKHEEQSINKSKKFPSTIFSIRNTAIIVCIIGVVILLIASNFGGLLTAKAEVKVTSVDRTKTSHRVYNSNATWDYADYNDYSFTIQLKNVGNKGAEIRVTLLFYTGNWDASSKMDQKTVGYIDSGDTTSVTLKITDDKIVTENQHLKIEITVDVVWNIENTGYSDRTDDYQDTFFG